VHITAEDQVSRHKEDQELDGWTSDVTEIWADHGQSDTLPRTENYNSPQCLTAQVEKTIDR